jgi:hypothetical protein
MRIKAQVSRIRPGSGAQIPRAGKGTACQRVQGDDTHLDVENGKTGRNNFGPCGVVVKYRTGAPSSGELWIRTEGLQHDPHVDSLSFFVNTLARAALIGERPAGNFIPKS